MSSLFWDLTQTFLPTFRDNLTLEVGTYRLFRNLDKQQPINAAYKPEKSEDLKNWFVFYDVLSYSLVEVYQISEELSSYVFGVRSEKLVYNLSRYKVSCYLIRYT